MSATEVPPAVAPETERMVERFLFREARLLDTGRFAEWLDLFAPDGVYWVPSRVGQTDAKGVASIIYEDRSILAMRVQRLSEGRTQAPLPRTAHIVGNIEIVAADEASGAYDVASSLLVAEYTQGARRIFAGQCRHRLRRIDGALRIVEKRVDLIDCDAVHAAIAIPF